MAGNSFNAREQLTVGELTYEVFRLDRVDGAARLPYSLKVLLENLLRNEDGMLVTRLAGPTHRGRALGHIKLANYAGLAVGPPLARLVGAGQPARVLVLAASLPLLAAALAATLRLSSRRVRSRRTTGEAGEHASRPPAGHGPTRTRAAAGQCRLCRRARL
jgi:hypothetical protein